MHRIKVISWLSHYLSELNSLNSLNSFVLSVTAHSHSVNIDYCSRKALLQHQLPVRNIKEQWTVFIIICFKHLFKIILNLFRPHLVVSLHLLHLLTVRQLLQLHCLYMTLLSQRNTEDISVISIKTWLNYNRMNAFSAMKSDLIWSLILNRSANTALFKREVKNTNCLLSVIIWISALFLNICLN